VSELRDADENLLRDGGHVRLVCDGRLPRSQAEDVVRRLCERPGPLTFQVERKSLNTAGLGEPLLWDPLFEAIERYRSDQNVSSTDVVCLLTTIRNEHNWFSAVDPRGRRGIFIHASGWEWITSAPLSAVLSYEVIENVLELGLREQGLGLEEIAHKKPQGCLYDMCGEKRDFTLKLKTADICGRCLAILEHAKATDRLLRQTVAILEDCRRSAINTSRHREDVPSFMAWPYPVAVTRHKVTQAHDSLHRLLLLLNHFDSLIRYVCIAHSVLSDDGVVLPENPSLGWWVDRLGHVQGMPDVGAVCRIAQERRIVSKRNELVGHGFVRPGHDAYRSEAAKLESTLTDIERAAAPTLARVRPVVIREMPYTDLTFTLRGVDLVGSNVLFPSFSLTLPRATNPADVGLTDRDRVFLYDREKQLFRGAHPLIQLTMCSECGHERVLVADGGARYLDVLIGHRTELHPD